MFVKKVLLSSAALLLALNYPAISSDGDIVDLEMNQQVQKVELKLKMKKSWGYSDSIYKFEENEHPLTMLRCKIEGISDKHRFSVDKNEIPYEQEGQWTAKELKDKEVFVPPLNIMQKMKSAIDDESGKEILSEDRKFLSKDPFNQSSLNPEYKIGDFNSLAVDNGIAPDGPANFSGKEFSDEYMCLLPEERGKLIRNLSLGNGLILKSREKPTPNESFYNAACWLKFPGFMKPKYTLLSDQSFTFDKNVHELKSLGMWEAGGSIGMSGIFSAQGSYNEGDEKYEVNQNETMFMLSKYDVQKIILKISEEDIGPSEGFLISTKKALEGYDNERNKQKNEQSFTKNYRNLQDTLKKYGHYLPTQFVIGGRMYFEDKTTVSSKDEAENSFWGFSAGCEANLGLFGIPISGGAKASNSHDETEKNQSYHKAQKISRKVIGGSASKAANASDWIASLEYYQTWSVLEKTSFIPTIDLLPEDIRKKVVGVLSWVANKKVEDEEFPVNIRHYIGEIRFEDDSNSELKIGFN